MALNKVTGGLNLTIQDDGTIKINARGLVGTEAELLAALADLATEVGGDLEVEKHEPGIGHHHTHDGSTHGHGHG